MGCTLLLSHTVLAQEVQQSGKAADVLRAWRELSLSCS